MLNYTAQFSTRCFLRATRSLHQSSILSSHIGSKPIVYPSEVEITHDMTPISDPRIPSELNNTTLKVKGPKGNLSMCIKPFVNIEISNPNENDSASSSEIGGNVLKVNIQDPSEKKQKAMWGTTRAHIQNMITGVTDTFTLIIRIVGVGYRAAIADGGKGLTLKLGYSHNLEVDIPEGLAVTVPQPTKIIINGTDKHAVGSFAAKIRRFRKPEPYRGKGVFVGDETIKLKDSKGKKK